MPHFPPHIISATSTFTDGNMSFRFGETQEVIKNRGQFLDAHTIPFSKHICMACENGETILEVTKDTPGVGADDQTLMPLAEVLVTRETNLALMLPTADCIPASFYDPVQKVIALAHLNRHTIAHDLAEKTVSFFCQQYGSNPADLLVHFGPHVKVDSYIFDIPLETEPPAQLADFVLKQNHKVKIDLQGAFTHQLRKAGVLKEQICIDESDTARSANHFSHYRSSRDTAYPQGRLATILLRHDQA